MISFEISRKPNPVVVVSYDPDWTCPRCKKHYRLDHTGYDTQCVICIMPPGGKLRLYGWLVEEFSGRITVHHL